MSVSVCACVWLIFYSFLFVQLQTGGGRERRCGVYLSEADLCCLEAQHFKPSLSCAHKYQSSSFCCFPPPIPLLAVPSAHYFYASWLRLKNYANLFGHRIALLLLPVCHPSPLFTLAVVRRVEAAKLHWIIAWAVCLFQLGLLDDIPPTWYRVVSRFVFLYSLFLSFSIFPTLSILSVPVALIAWYLFEVEKALSISLCGSISLLLSPTFSILLLLSLSYSLSPSLLIYACAVKNENFRRVAKIKSVEN